MTQILGPTGTPVPPNDSRGKKILKYLDKNKESLISSLSLIIATFALVVTCNQNNKNTSIVEEQFQQSKVDRQSDSADSHYKDSLNKIKDSVQLLLFDKQNSIASNSSKALSDQSKVSELQYRLQKRLVDMQILLDRGNIIVYGKQLERTSEVFGGLKRPIINTIIKNVGKRNIVKIKSYEYVLNNRFKIIPIYSNSNEQEFTEPLPVEGQELITQTFTALPSEASDFFVFNLFEFKDEILDSTFKNKFYYHYYQFNGAFNFNSCNADVAKKIDSSLKANQKHL